MKRPRFRIMRSDHLIDPSRPTELIVWKIKFFSLEIQLSKFLGDISSRGYWRHRKIWFSSNRKHPRFNKLLSRAYQKLESANNRTRKVAGNSADPRAEANGTMKAGPDCAKTAMSTGTDEKVA